MLFLERVRQDDVLVFCGAVFGHATSPSIVRSLRVASYPEPSFKVDHCDPAEGETCDIIEKLGQELLDNSCRSAASIKRMYFKVYVKLSYVYLFLPFLCLTLESLISDYIGRCNIFRG